MGFCFSGFLNGVSAVYMVHFASSIFLLKITLAFRSNHAPSLGIRSFYLVCHDVRLNGDPVSIGIFLCAGLFALDEVVGSYLFM
jgi:hypothetical protein